MHVDINIGEYVTEIIDGGVIRYYAVPFSPGGITVRLDVSVGYATCYISDIIRNPGPDNYVWLIDTRGYGDEFIDPAEFGRSETRYIYIAIVGGYWGYYGVGGYMYQSNTYLLNSTIGNFSSQGIMMIAMH